MYNFITHVCQATRNFFAPSFCVHCKKWLEHETILCDGCRTFIQPVASAKIELTKKITMTVFSVSNYEDPLKSLILAKSRSDHLASKYIGRLIWELSSVNQSTFDYIVPIPLHWRRYAYRGYNQASVIAQELSKKSKKPVADLLKRTQYTVFQSVLSSDERQENVRNAFIVRDIEIHQFHNKHLLLVDDLMTTGATLQAVAKCLLPLKPSAISAAVLCRTL